MDSNRELRAWVQVIGAVAVHASDRAPSELTTPKRTLLATLVAAGPEGAWLEEIAHAYWPTERPISWRAALTVTFRNLEAQLPEGWKVEATEFTIRLVPAADGWVDAWRLEEAAPFDKPPPWLIGGTPFAGIEGVPLVDRAALRIRALIPTPVTDADGAARPPADLTREADLVRASRRVILLGSIEDRARIASALRKDDLALTRLTGDKDLLLPLGPYAMAFPGLRAELDLQQGAISSEEVATAFRIVADSLCEKSSAEPHRLAIRSAHELDTASLALTMSLLERGPINNLSIILGADHQARDLRWLDFVARAQTAGCRVIHLDTVHG